jgi:hypothetical protein
MMQRHDIENTVRVPFLSGLADHWRESYVCEMGKSMKAEELPLSQEGGWRKIATTLIDPLGQSLNECNRLP